VVDHSIDRLERKIKPTQRAVDPVDHTTVLSSFLFWSWIQFWSEFRSFNFLFFVDSL